MEIGSVPQRYGTVGTPSGKQLVVLRGLVLEEEDIVNRSYIPGGNVELHLKKCEIRALRAGTGEVLASQTVTAEIPMNISVEYRMQNGVVLNPEAGKTYTAAVDSEQYTAAYMALCETIGIPWEE